MVSDYCAPSAAPLQWPHMTKMIAVGCLAAVFLAVSARHASAQG